MQWDIVGIEPATAAHIHEGAVGIAGPVVVTLPTPDADSLGEACAGDGALDPVLLQAIVDDPNAYYVNVHNGDFPDGRSVGSWAKPYSSSK